MNNNKEIKKNRITEFPICQFYIVLGKHNREFKNTKKKKFFPIRGNEDIELIQYAVNAEYKKKKKEGYAVAGEIIFLIPDIKYQEVANILMDKLNFKGSIQIVPSEIKKEVKKEEDKPKEEKTKARIIDTPKEIVSSQEKEKQEDKKETDITETKKELENKTEINKTIGKKVLVKPKQEEKEQDASSYMWGDSLPKEKRKSKVKPIASKEKSQKKKIDLPIIIFLLSALLLIGSVILLFILK